MQTKFSATHPEPISWRPILITLFLLPVFYWWHIECEALPSFGPPPTLMSPLYTVVLAVLILSSLNLLLKKFYPKVYPDRRRVNHRLRVDVNVADLHVLRHVPPVGLYRRARLLFRHARK